MDLRAEEEGWTGSANVGITLATGNSESLRSTAGLEVSGVFGDWEAQAKAEAVYGEDDGVRSHEQLEASLKLNRDLTSRLYLGVSGDSLYDPLAGIDYRVGLGPHVGIRLLDDERVLLKVEAGPGYTWEKRDGEESGFVSIRLHEEFSYQLTAGTRLFQSLTAVLEAAEPDNHLITARAGVESRLAGDWSMRLAGKAVRYGESSSKESDDLLVTIGLGYNFMPVKQDEKSLLDAHAKRKSTDGQWVVTALLGGSLAEGNSESSALHVGLEAKRKRSNDKCAVGLFGSYGETEGEVSNEAIDGHGFYQRRFGAGWFWGLRGDAQHDARSDLDWRFALTPYLGRELIENETTSMSIEAGPSLVVEQQGSGPDTYLGTYAALKAEHHIGEATRLFGELSLLAESAEWSNVLLSSEAGVEQRINDHLSLKVIGRSTYDSAPADDRERHDFQLVSALGVTF